ncbi:transposase [Mycolicibacterium peregrinum]|uniref:transposase n=1 Tax=Mycolicibacterium peregrinum TaxID=43304 RepID=UPI001EEE4C9E|nr:transposase [Mycolicibacterium peregrinum]
MLARCEEIMNEVCADFEAELREFNGEHDHVLHYPPKVARYPSWSTASKGVSARHLRQEYAPTSENTCEADTSGPAPTSPDHAAERP